MVKIEITGDTPLEALASLPAFGLHCVSNPDVYAAANHILEAEKNAQKAEVAATPTSGKTDAPGLAPATSGQTVPPSDPSPTTPPAVSAEDAPTPPTVAQVRERGIEASRKHGKEAIVAILKQFGASGMSAIAEKDRAAFLAKLDELDAGEKAGGEDA